MKLNLLSSLSLSSAYLFTAADATYAVYKTTIAPIPGVDTSVSGSVVVIADTADGTSVGYGGYVNGLQAGLEATTCTAKNGCGVHIHSGTGCDDSTAQGGHYFADPVTEDPWVEARYSSDAEGNTEFGASLKIGTVDLEGRAFLVHAEDGSRVGCGILTKVAETDYLSAELDSLGDSEAVGAVTALPVAESDLICYMGFAMKLEPDLVSVYSDAQGLDCTAGNGCGVHVHAGTSCESKETQMGHYYSGDVDPWAIIGYDSTSADGFTTYFDCVSTGETEYDGKAFIVHASDGSRVACGLLGTGSDDKPVVTKPPTATPVADPTDAPIAYPTDAPIADHTHDAPVADATTAPTDDSAGTIASVTISLAGGLVGLLATLV